MRSQIWLLAASGHLASANRALERDLDYRGGEAAYYLPMATEASTHDGEHGWTPRPTEGPSLELARRRRDWGMFKRQTENTWVDETTCGWRASTVSEPFTCGSSATCATNSDNVVGCSSSGGPDPFFTVCLDYAAVQAGACETVGSHTGCCMTSSIGQCVTYLWPGATVKSMFRCYTERDVITMLSTPWARTTSTTSSTSSSSSSSTTSETPTSTVSDEPAVTTTDPPVSDDGGGTNVGAIAGGVVGGVAGLALIAGAIAFFLIRRKKKNSNVGAGTAYSAVAPGDTSYPGGGAGMQQPGYPPSSVSPQMSQAGYFSPGSVGTTVQPETPYLAAGNLAPVPGAYNQHHSYYDPAKQPTPGASPHSQYAYPGGYPPQQPVSELDNTAVTAGHQSNPIEMPATGPHAELSPQVDRGAPAELR